MNNGIMNNGKTMENFRNRACIEIIICDEQRQKQLKNITLYWNNL